jgi:LysM repeat protein
MGRLYDRDGMVARKWAARLIAPVAIAAPIVGGYLIVHHYVETHKSSHSSHPHASRNADKPKGKYAKAKFYIVKSGDNLTRIAAKTGVPVDKLVVLNPRINPNTLQTGQKIRLRR